MEELTFNQKMILQSITGISFSNARRLTYSECFHLDREINIQQLTWLRLNGLLEK